MQGQVIAAGSLAAIVSMLVVVALSAGFGVSLAQAVAQSLPAILVSGAVVALTTLVLRKEPT